MLSEAQKELAFQIGRDYGMQEAASWMEAHEEEYHVKNPPDWKNGWCYRGLLNEFAVIDEGASDEALELAHKTREAAEQAIDRAAKEECDKALSLRKQWYLQIMGMEEEN